MTFTHFLRQQSTIAVMACMTALAGCASAPPPLPVEWQNHVTAVSALQAWSLSGRLNIREGQQSDTVNLNWSQTNESFAIRLSGTLGLGAVHLEGDNDSVVLEKAGEEPRLLPGLDALSSEYLDYEFPAAYLRWWVRGLPVPYLPVSSTLNEQSLLQTLVQTSPSGQRFELSFDRYEQVQQIALPGRINLQSQGVTLRFLIDGWQTPASSRQP
jgi:outer membrane lipoprotein LolB